jgi:putative proteasome-type protease
MYDRLNIGAPGAREGPKHMTYCLSIAINEGLVFSSDSRTNAGADQVRTYSKMRTFVVPRGAADGVAQRGQPRDCQDVIAKLERDIGDALPRSLLSVRK